MITDIKITRDPTFRASLFIFLLVVSVVCISIICWSVDAQIALFGALVVVSLFALYMGYSLDSIEKMIMRGVERSSLMLMFNVMIGLLVAAWIAAGIIPYIIYLGLAIFSPRMIPFWACALCLLMSMLTGSSWTTAGTIGLAFVVIGSTMGYPIPLVASAVMTGAMLGDKNSPLSETTVFAAFVSDVKLMDHVSSMKYTTIPSFLISLVIYWVLGIVFVHSGQADVSEITHIRHLLYNTFNLNPVLLVMPLLLIAMLVKKVNSLLCLGSATVIGAMLCVVMQDMTIPEMAVTMMSGMQIKTGSEIVDLICSKGGLNSMWYTISITILGFAMSEVLSITHVYDVLISHFADKLTTVKSIIVSSLAVGVVLSFGTGCPYLPALITGDCYKKLYNKLGIDRRVLSRVLEDGTTITQPMIPWGASGVFFSTLFGCTVMEYLPYYLLGYINPLVAVFCAVTGYGVFYTNGKRGWGKNRYDIKRDGPIPISVTEAYYDR